MPVAEHFDALSVYGAAAIRLVPVDGEPEDLLGEGGRLQERFEALGRRPLVAVLRDASVRGVVLGDGDLKVQLDRVGAGGLLRVSWDEAVVVEERVEIPPMQATWAGPWFRPEPASEVRDVAAALGDVADPLVVVSDVGGAQRWYRRGYHGRGAGEVALRATVPAVDPGSLGSAAFRNAHGLRMAYVAGAMAGGIGSAEIVIAMAKAGLIGFFGAGGLPLPAVEQALQTVVAGVGTGAWGFNLLHNPAEPAMEERTVDLFLKWGVRRADAAAYMSLTPAVVRYRTAGIHRDASGRIVAPNHVFAKISRPEVAERFLRPPPADLLRDLVASGALTAEQAAMASELPVAEDVTAEADSGGHTDHRPLVVLLPEIQRLRDRVAREHGYDASVRPRVGAAGGLGTPQAVWAAFAMGADYVLTGSVNQATREAGTSELAKQLLVEAQFFDVATGPAPDMFEIGAKVQVLSRGSMYAQRAQRLYEIYRSYGSIEEIPKDERGKIEKQFFKRDLDEVWAETKAYWQQRDPSQVEKAERDGRVKMALTFRWYLGMTSRWARTGDADRKRDYQIWCGPAMGAFNRWVEGSALQPLEARTVVGIAEALMVGAATQARIAAARVQGVALPVDVDGVAPRV